MADNDPNTFAESFAESFADYATPISYNFHGALPFHPAPSANPVSAPQPVFSSATPTANAATPKVVKKPALRKKKIHGKKKKTKLYNIRIKNPDPISNHTRSKTSGQTYKRAVTPPPRTTMNSNKKRKLSDVEDTIMKEEDGEQAMEPNRELAMGFSQAWYEYSIALKFGAVGAQGRKFIAMTTVQKRLSSLHEELHACGMWIPMGEGIHPRSLALLQRARLRLAAIELKDGSWVRDFTDGVIGPLEAELDLAGAI